jgi:hypothetical protein
MRHRLLNAPLQQVVDVAIRRRECRVICRGINMTPARNLAFGANADEQRDALRAIVAAIRMATTEFKLQ